MGKGMGSWRGTGEGARRGEGMGRDRYAEIGGDGCWVESICHGVGEDGLGGVGRSVMGRGRGV